jgi:hypothetical protein
MIFQKAGSTLFSADASPFRFVDFRGLASSSLGRIYGKYGPCEPGEVFGELLAAASKGRYFHSHIKNQYRHSKVG